MKYIIRKEQNQDADIEAIRVALIKAEGRGMGSRTPEQIKQAVQKRLKKRVIFKLNDAKKELE